MLPVEKEFAQEQIISSVKKLEEKKSYLENTLECPYPRLSFEPLKWQTKEACPKLCNYVKTAVGSNGCFR